MVQSTLGLGPWDVLHEGLSIRFGLSIGTWVILMSGVVLLAWIPLKEPLGIGTVINALLIGTVLDLTTAVVPVADATFEKWAFTGIGILLVGFGSGLYIGANLGPGPRDGLMTGIARRGPSIRLTRTGIEITVLIIGVLLGGTFGIATILFAVLIGPLVQLFLPRWTIKVDAPASAKTQPAP